jgi:capsular polysaccharide transport system permease protein
LTIPPAIAPAGTTRRFATCRAIAALMLREMSTRYGRSPGGFVWAILEPLGGIIVLSLALSLIIRAPSLGNSFVLFYATGLLPFTLYNTVQSMVAKALIFSKPLLVYPSVTWVDAIMGRFLLNTLTGVMVTYLLLAGVLHATETTAVVRLGPVVTALALAALLGLGVGVLNCLIFGLYPVWEQIWSILTRPLFLASGIFFIMEDLPRQVQDYLWFSPWMHISGLLRSGVYPTYDAPYASALFVLFCAMVPLCFGLLLLRRYHKDILAA